MDAGMVSKVRRFSRTVTQRIGALNDHYLGSARPLGEARLLWEIGDGRDLRSLRAALGLDSGYLSRLLRSLEADGLVTVQAELETLARQRGACSIRLETNRSLTEAIALYRSAGFEEVPPFNAEPHAHHWFRKQLT